MDAIEHVRAWEATGEHVTVGADQVFVGVHGERRTGTVPLVYLHGYPTSSIDLAAVVAELEQHRQVVTIDLPGCGLSTKLDRPYSLFGQADVVVSVMRSLGIEECDLLTHDMGDSVGGEVLARSLNGALGVQVRRRVITNGSIYMDLAQLTDGQQLLLSLPDEALPDELAPDAATMLAALVATLAPEHPGNVELEAAAELVAADGGAALLARLIRYVEERRRYEWRWTGAIETHPAPLGILWGALDPIAVVAMAHRLAERRPDAALWVLEGVGHYPMVEDPARTAALVAEFLA